MYPHIPANRKRTEDLGWIWPHIHSVEIKSVIKCYFLVKSSKRGFKNLPSAEISENLLCPSFLLHQDNKALLCSGFPTQVTLTILKLIMCKESRTKALVSISPDEQNAKACQIHEQN